MDEINNGDSKLLGWNIHPHRKGCSQIMLALGLVPTFLQERRRVTNLV